MSEIKEDQKAKLLFKMADDSEKEFDCQIKEVQKDRISLKFPDELLEYSDFLEEGIELPVQIFTPSGIKSFDSIVLNSPLEAEFVIEYSENNIIQIQRRKYLRTELRTKLIINREGNVNIVTYTNDIGGGGVRFYYAGTFEKEEKVECMLYLPMQMRSVMAKGIVIDGSHLKENEHVLLFTDIDEKERDRIIKACFENELANYSNVDEVM